jgi:ribosomal protein S18 acetylase RimI-like enzyme
VVIKALSGLRARIEEVVVDEIYRGHGIGKELMLVLIELAKKLKISSMELTSRPSRVAANELYRHLGFVQRTTNVHEMKF